ncbi:MAG: helix-hairpin-helix domain-containing protein [Desulfobulbaceae bacterium]|nr:helix-hairpin-helix domain-containing protein [Desulfobulbaceae bacterium]
MHNDPDDECRGRDKRLLVLLALGLCVVLVNYSPAGPLPQKKFPPLWFEVRGEDSVCYRFFRPEQFILLQEAKTIMPAGMTVDRNTMQALAEGMRERKVAAVTSGGEGSARPAPPSPRLSFFLEQSLPVNTANEEELTLIPGIGPYLAGNIVKYRRENGNIDHPGELRAVPGIGKQRAEKLSPYFTFE